MAYIPHFPSLSLFPIKINEHLYFGDNEYLLYKYPCKNTKQLWQGNKLDVPFLESYDLSIECKVLKFK